MSFNLANDEIKRGVAEHVQAILAGGFVIKFKGGYTSVTSLQFPNRPLDTHLTVKSDYGDRHFTLHIVEHFTDKNRGAT